MRKIAWFCLACGLLGGLVRGAYAENEGQATLDQATEKKLTAESLQDLTEVVELCDQALKQGLDEANTQFANSLLTGTLVQRGTALAGAIFERNPVDPRWPTLRALALKDLERAVSIDAKLGEALYLIARLNALPEGDRARAAKAADQAVELTKGNPLAQAKALTLRANLGSDKEKRQADYDQAIKLSPKDEEALRGRALFYLMEGKLEQAVADLESAIQLRPKDPATHEAKAIALLGLKKLDESIASLNTAIELAPDSHLPYFHRARVRMEQKDTKAALEDLEQSLKLDPDNVSTLVLRARVHQLDNNPQAAKADVEAALHARPGLAPALELRAMLAATNGDFASAAADFEELLKVMPKNAELLTQLGILYQASKRPRAAIERFTKALAEDKNNFVALRSRGDAYLSTARQAEAVADYEAALKIKPKDSGVLNNIAWTLATSLDDKLRVGKRAIELAKTACEATNYKQAHIISTLAAAYAEEGEWDEAVKWSKKANELGDEKVRDQLQKELASYEAKKPWREVQDEPEEEPKSPSPPQAAPTGDAPAPAAETEKKEEEDLESKEEEPSPPL